MVSKNSASAVKKSKVSDRSANTTAEITPLESEKKRKDSHIQKKEKALAAVNHLAKPNGVEKTTTVSENVVNKSEKGSSLHQTKALAGVLSRFPIVFTKDSKYFFCCVSNTIKIYNVTSGEVVKTLSTSALQGGHRDTVTALCLNPKNPLQLYSASLDGTIKLWDYNDNILLKTHQVNLPIENMVISPQHPENAYIVTRRSGSNPETKGKTAVYRYAFQKSNHPEGLTRITKSKDSSVIAVSADGRFLATASRYRISIWEITNDKEVSKEDVRTYTSPELVTCLAFSPTEPCLAIGDEAGKITLYYCFTPETEKTPVTALMHWHHRPLNTLSFTADGVYLLSGGEEPVLVMWQLETGHKQFLPRVGGEIKSITISPNQSLYALSEADNSIRIINAVSQQIVRIIQGLQYAQVASNTYPLYTGLVIEPRNHHVVMNGVPGNIQFYNPYLDSHVLDLEVAPITRISRPDENELIFSLVRHVAFMDDGSWMATIDSRDDNVTTPELYLKFWSWDPDAQSYILKTRVDYPHSAEITSLSFRHGSDSDVLMAITASADKTFKIWHLTNDLGRHHPSSEASWACRSVGFYRDNTPTVTSFSQDGSMLAVAFGQVLTIWDPIANNIQGTLALPPQQCHIQRLAFLGSTPFIAAVTKSHLYVWNLLTCTVWWSYNMTIDHLAVDQQTGVFAVVCNAQDSKESRFIVFEPTSPVPKFVHTVSEICKAIAWIPVENHEVSNSLLSSNLVYLNQNCDLQVLHASGDDLEVEQELEGAKLLKGNTERSFFADIFGKSNKSAEDRRWDQQRVETAEALRQEAASASRSRTTARSKQGSESTFLDAPSHVIQSVDSIFELFMDSIMPKRPDAEDRDAEMDEIDEVETASHTESEAGTSFDTMAAAVPLSVQEVDQDIELVPVFDSLNAFFTKTAELNINGKVNGAVQVQEESSSDEDSEEDTADIEW
ncbi:hypothetical protein INT44_006933 [Umbelopsis vinacea]|uniref:WD repeat-containing protein 75 second beta-propeller domain-containing protein n=1 Tax=Umbelopsis vinacea TaxID=44442 RepID=A0A8H7UCM8_9FUNG|nr:hypothetical protein INT44_006933 [Umbelopsis vinacea]